MKRTQRLMDQAPLLRMLMRHQDLVYVNVVEQGNALWETLKALGVMTTPVRVAGGVIQRVDLRGNNPRPGSAGTEAGLIALANEWLRRARSRYVSGALAGTEHEKELLESGALCYFNCSEEIRKLADGLRASPTQRAPKGRKKRLGVDDIHVAFHGGAYGS